ncbi:hypothetical protein FRX31_019052 [Thalictrum thalictroides]|uniref:Uncharacterized protein n=1 Tax=Thalictrum thalictroides TaxID=46969 RepID=A0A7J6W4D1_THATH|nr:hypothetical protein FRX31_019052 [Thalictrum thalictroides]
MGRPSRRVRSARDRWFKARRFTPVLERLYAAVRRTLCNQHFDKFHSFLGGLSEVCTMVAEADPSIEGEIAAYFPDSERVTQQLWKNFKGWLKSDMGEPIRGVCLQWCRYARHVQLICDDCRGAEPIMVDFESDVETEDDAE